MTVVVLAHRLEVTVFRAALTMWVVTHVSVVMDTVSTLTPKAVMMSTNAHPLIHITASVIATVPTLSETIPVTATQGSYSRY